VGTPGRLCQLVQAGSLRTEDVTMFVLDEADALLGESLYADVTWIYDLLPRRKQVAAVCVNFESCKIGCQVATLKLDWWIWYSCLSAS